MYQLQVENMSCGHCVGAVTEAVQGVDAAATVVIELASKSVRIDSTTPLASLTAAISAAGFPVSAAS